MNCLVNITTCPIEIIFPINGSLIPMSQTKVLPLLKHIPDLGCSQGFNYVLPSIPEMKIKILRLHIHCNSRKEYLKNPFVVKAVKCCLPVCNTEIGVDKGKVYIRLNELSRSSNYMPNRDHLSDQRFFDTHVTNKSIAGTKAYPGLLPRFELCTTKYS